MKEKIKKFALTLGFTSVGITSTEKILLENNLNASITAGRNAEMKWLARNVEKRCDPKSILPSAKSVICLALPYGECGIEGTEDCDQKKARYARGKDYHDVALEKMHTLWKFVKEIFPDAQSKFCVDTSPILEKALAERAGIGFIGKHSILINESLGSWFILCEIITNIELEPDQSAKNLCGDCKKCIEACPTKAIVAPFCVDSRRCISYWTTFSKSLAPPEIAQSIPDGTFGCDICQEVCPYNS